MKELRCKDSGADCDFVATAETEDEILRMAEQHALADHGMPEVPDDLKARMKSLIRDV